MGLAPVVTSMSVVITLYNVARDNWTNEYPL